MQSSDAKWMLRGKYTSRERMEPSVFSWEQKSELLFTISVTNAKQFLPNANPENKFHLLTPVDILSGSFIKHFK